MHMSALSTGKAAMQDDSAGIKEAAPRSMVHSRARLKKKGSRCQSTLRMTAASLMGASTEKASCCWSAHRTAFFLAGAAAAALVSRVPFPSGLCSPAAGNSHTPDKGVAKS